MVMMGPYTIFFGCFYPMVDFYGHDGSRYWTMSQEPSGVEAVLVLHINNCPQRHRRNDRGGRCARHGKNDWLKGEIR